MGLIYQVTHNDRRLPFMSHVDRDDPLALSWRRPGVERERR
jgi:homoserine O-succinyltransferase